ncbi:MAG: HAMP domain-containing histidine kinase [Deltaproteobacteria bacterium]|nr:HAMP domain-containing histidine kinase [Deltaproteobacteria bacterium]
MTLLVAKSLFAVGVLEWLAWRVRRDAGGRADSRYFEAMGHLGALRLLVLAFGLLANGSSRGVVLPERYLHGAGMCLTLWSCHALVLFAYAFPLNRRPPRALLAGLGSLTVALTLALPWITRAQGPATMLMLVMVAPYFALAVLFVRRNWHAATAPGDTRPPAPVRIVQASLVYPWAASIVLFSVLHARAGGPLPTQLYLTHSLVMTTLTLGGIGVAILRYHLFESRVLVAEVLLAVVASGCFAGYAVYLAPPLHGYLTATLGTVFATVFVASGPPFAIRLALSVLDRHMNRMACSLTGSGMGGDAARALAATEKVVDPDGALAAMTTAVASATRGEVTFLRSGSLPPGERADADPALVALLEAHPRRFFAREQHLELPEALVTAMRALDASLVVPVARNGVTFGLFVVRGCRISRRAALESATIAEHLAIKFENWALFAEVARADRALADYKAYLRSALEEHRRLAALGSFAAAVAHDLRTPLTSIQMNVQIVRSRGYVPDGDREYLDIAVEEIERLNRSVGELLEFAKPLHLQVEDSDPRELLEDVRRALEPVLSERGMTLTVRHEGVGHARIDERRLRQVLVNLVDNAAAASERGAEILLKSRHDGGSVTFEVEDHGRGIAPENLGRIFEPFFTTRPDGTGLGLAIAQKIVRAHGGELRVLSRPGEATVFSAQLPPEPPAEGALEPAHAAE